MLQTDGDGLRAFFEADGAVPPVARALGAARKMADRIVILEEQLRQQGAVSESYSGLHFRGGVSEGSIKPIWQNIGGGLMAAWTESAEPGNHPLIEASRMLESEKSIEGADACSRIVLPDRLAPWGVAPFGGRWSIRSRTIRLKHGDAQSVSVLVVRDQSGHDVRTAA